MAIIEAKHRVWTFKDFCEQIPVALKVDRGSIPRVAIVSIILPFRLASLAYFATSLFDCCMREMNRYNFLYLILFSVPAVCSLGTLKG